MRRLLRILAAVCLITIPLAIGIAQQTAPDDLARRFAQAEALYTERSYERAKQFYDAVDISQLSDVERRWVTFRRADAKWRAAAGNPSAHAADSIGPEASLQVLIRESEEKEQRDRIWAEAQESLGDLNASNGSGESQQHHLAALQWWGESSDIDAARQRYLSIVWKMADGVRGGGRGYRGGSLPPVEVIENALKIAVTPTDRSRAAWLMATSLQHDNSPLSRDRVEEAFETALQAGRSAEWYDDALFAYAQWMERSGRAVELKNGEWRIAPDYVRALTIYQRIVSEFKEGETQYFREAGRRYSQIVSAALTVTTAGVFVPGSEVELNLHSRNVASVAFEIYPIDLVDDVTEDGFGGKTTWVQSVEPAASKRIASWSRTIEGSSDHEPRSVSFRLEQELARGAYLVVARAGGITSKELILVSDATIVMRTSPKETTVYTADAFTGAPLPGTRVRLLDHFNIGGTSSQRTEIHNGVTDADGIARFRIAHGNYSQFLVTAANGDRQAFVQSYRTPSGRQTEAWRIYAVTDRPAYRPDETVRWKITARLYDGSVYRNPAGRSLQYEIKDPRNAKVASGTALLNAFGSFWADLPLTSSMPLGMYSISFKESDGQHDVGASQLFRLEEYKLPEFRVSIEMPKENGKPKVFRLGDRVTATVRAEYYFGGGVPNANVEVVVTQRPFFHIWRPQRDFGWYHEEARPRHYYGTGPVVKREVIRTDAEGKAEISFDTPRGSQDAEYSIEARVTDASRREVVGSGTVRVSNYGYFVTALPEHHLYRPGSSAKIDFHAQDANAEPVAVTGTVRVVRQRTWEVWRDPQGKRVEGEALERERARHSRFPPPTGGGWTFIRRVTEEDDVLTQTVTTNAQGDGSLTFTPDRDGYYRIRWTSDDRRDLSRPKRPSDVVRAETAIWVASAATKRLGYHTDGIEIIADRDTFRAGETAHLMIVTPASGGYVLLGVEAEEIFETRLLRMDGNAKLVEIAIDEKHVPNFFVTAYRVADLQLLGDTERIVVPPVRQFVDVGVTPTARQLLPGEKGQLTITTRDLDGKPVSAEVAVAVFDESVEAIQGELAVDPRKFFYGTTRSHGVQTTSSFGTKAYIRLDAKVESADSESDQSTGVSDLRQRRESLQMSSKAEGSVEGGVVSGVMGGVLTDQTRVTANAPLVPPPAPMAEPAPVAPTDQVITVRSNFSSTALWIADLKTGQSGTATVDVTYPDSLTTWKTTATAVTTESRFGRGNTTTTTRKPLMVRLQGPRFLVVGDEATISAVVNNSTSTAMQVATALDLSGLEVVSSSPTSIAVAPNGDARVDWKVRARAPGVARIRISGRAPADSDAMERTIPVFEHGIDKLVAVSGRTRGSDTVAMLDIPAERRRDSTELVVQLTPSLAVTMLDALPYLVEFPYGCTEQTMSRFLPAVITLKTLGDLGMSREDAAKRIFGGIEQRTAAETHSNTTPGLARLDAVMRASISRLRDFQHGDGGWGWWKEGESDPYMTAYVVWGLALAREADVEFRADMLDRGVSYLQKKLVESEDAPDMQAWMLHALASTRNGGQPHEFEAKAIENLWTSRDELRPYSRALFALSLHRFGARDRALVLVRNLENGAQIDRTPDRSIISRGGSDTTAETLATARWGARNFWWRWWDGPVESTAFVLRALSTIDPKHPLIEPAMNWLVKNRRGAQWSSTKETAIAVLALNDYLKTSGELASAGTYELLVNGTSIAKQTVTAADVLRAPSRYRIDPKLVRDGRNEVQIVRSGGASNLYFAAEARFFSLEEPVTAAGNQIFVRREYFRITGRPTLLAGYLYDRIPLKDGESIASGERIEVVVHVETKNDLEYLIFEDLKPAGLEAVALQSGQNLFATRVTNAAAAAASGARRPGIPNPGTVLVHQELRDRKIATFADRLDQGIWELRYTLRAETPGTFHALPLIGSAMYVPEIRANSEEVRVRVTE